MALIDEHFVGNERRLQQLNELTDVTFNIVLPPNEEAIPTTHLIMAQLPTFESFDSPPKLDDLVAALKNGPTLVKFINADGEEREMLCTMNEAYIPFQHRVKTHEASLQEVVFAPNPDIVTKYTKAQDPNLLKVYALERTGWRSFRFERLISFKPLFNPT